MWPRPATSTASMSPRTRPRSLSLAGFFSTPTRSRRCVAACEKPMPYLVLTCLLSTRQITHESVLVKPVNTPITPLCSKCPFITSAIHLPSILCPATSRFALPLYSRLTSAIPLHVPTALYRTGQLTLTMMLRLSKPDDSDLGTCSKRRHLQGRRLSIRYLCHRVSDFQEPRLCLRHPRCLGPSRAAPPRGS